MKKRIIAIMLSVMMVVTFIPTIAFANETGGSGANAPAATGEDISIDPSEVDELLASSQAFTELVEGLDPEGMSQDLEVLEKQLDSLDVSTTSKKGATKSAIKIPDEEFFEYLENLSTRLDREIALVDIYNDWLMEKIMALPLDLLPDDLQEPLNDLRYSLNDLYGFMPMYRTAAADLRDAVTAYLDAPPEELDNRIEDIKLSLDKYSSSVLSMSLYIVPVSKAFVDTIKAFSNRLFPKEDDAVSVRSLTTDTDALAAKLELSLDSYTKLREAYDNLKTILSKYDLITPEISDAFKDADLSLDAAGDSFKRFFDDAIVRISDYLKENLDSSVTSASLQSTLVLLRGYKAVIDKQLENIITDATGENATTSISNIISTLTKIIDFVKSFFGSKDAEKIAQLEDMNKYLAEQNAMLENAAKITQAKPNLKSVKSKNKKVTGKWAAVSTGTVSYYQVYYKVSGKKAVKVDVTSYDAAAKTISYTTKKLTKGKKCTFKVRGVYKMVSRNDPSDPNSTTLTSTYYTNWSKSKTVKVK